MTDEKRIPYAPSDEWLKWMESFDEDDAKGKLEAINYLLMMLVDSTYLNQTSLRRIENTQNMLNREWKRIQEEAGGYVV